MQTVTRVTPPITPHLRSELLGYAFVLTQVHSLESGDVSAYKDGFADGFEFAGNGHFTDRGSGSGANAGGAAISAGASRHSTGTAIAVRYDEAERIIVMPDETAPITLIVAQDVRSASGTVLIRSGSTIAGELRPDGGGTRFFAETLTPAGSTRSIPIDATSGLITERETITRESDPDFLRGAAIGAAAGAVIGEIFGNIDLGEVLLGAGVGTLASVLLRGRDEVEVVVVNPATDLTLTLQSNFVLR
ncbi:MAG: hypothetical protein HC895_24940 [Leptolyngbyaceae cyanobacterium SM1_3_5]|nr:hypothetical protein [Leptolyngbyaceae cyanobacterium SM1_3_5]